MQHLDRSNVFLSLQQPRPLRCEEGVDHWLLDPNQLLDWQGELVDSCLAINDQLTQINAELKVESDQELRIFGHPGITK